MVSPGPPAETGELHNAVTDSDAWWMPDNLDAPAGSTLVQTEPCCSMRQGPGWRFLQHRRVPRREVVGGRQPMTRHDSTCGRRQPCRRAMGDVRWAMCDGEWAMMGRQVRLLLEECQVDAAEIPPQRAGAVCCRACPPPSRMPGRADRQMLVLERRVERGSLASSRAGPSCVRCRRAHTHTLCHRVE